MNQLAMFASVVVPPPYPDDPSAIIVSVSGGVDSDACAVWARRRWPDHPIILWHAYLANMDWGQTGAHLDLLGERLGNCRRVTIQAVYELTGEATPSGYRSTRLRRLHDVQTLGPALDNDPAAITDLLQFWEDARLGMPPTLGKRYCTDYFKQTPFEVWCRANRANLGQSAVLLSGERHRESDNRAKVAPWEWRSEVALKPKPNSVLRVERAGFRLLWARPVIDLALHEVTRMVLDAGVPLVASYAIQGATTEWMLDPDHDERGRPRHSCITCIFTQSRHLKQALANEPAMVQPYVDRILAIEDRTGRTWKQSGALLGVDTKVRDR